MTWQDRITDAVIETAAGDRFVFEFRDLSSSREEKATVFSFPERTKDYVQRLSPGSEIFNIQLWFSGPDYDEVAAAFEVATKDPRPLIFTHPIKGVFDVQLISQQRDDRLATEANQAVFLLNMHETFDLAVPISSESAARFVDNTRTDLEFINSDDFEQAVELKTPAEINELKQGLQTAIETINSSVVAYAMITGALAEFQSIVLTAESLLTTVETNASAFASVYQGLINFPSRSLERLADKFDFFNNLIAGIDFADPDSTNLSLSAGVVGYCQVTLEGDEDFYVTKSNVFDTIQQVLDYKDLYYNTLDQIEIDFPDFEQNSEARTLLSDITATTAGNLNDIVFLAKQERIIRISKDEELYTLVYRLLGYDITEMDDVVLQFMDANKIFGSEMFELQTGRLLRYFV